MMKTTFQSLDGWAYSPQGSASGWSTNNGVVLSYGGNGLAQIYAGNEAWMNYSVQTQILLHTLKDYPGGLRAYVDPKSGASYAAWLYPAEGVIKLWRTSTWNINSGAVLLAVSSTVDVDTINWHSLTISVNTGEVVVTYDGEPVIAVEDAALTSGMVALDVSSQPVSFSGVVVTGDQAISSQLTSNASSLTFTAYAGAASATQSVNIGTDDGSAAAWSALSSSQWMKASPATGITPGSATFQVDATSLKAGTYNADLNVASFGTANNLSIPVTVNVAPPSTNLLTVAPSPLDFNAVWGDSTVSPATLAVTSTNSGLAFSVASDSPWLSTSAGGNTPASLSISVDPSGMTPGTYTGHLTFTSPAAMNPTTSIEVRMTIATPPVKLMESTLATMEGWANSPQGTGSGWSASSGVLSYDGSGSAQIYAGNISWSKYSAQTEILLHTMIDYPGGLRVYVNPSTGASYTAWLYPAEGVVKLWRTSTWNIATKAVLLGSSARLSMDTANWHTLGISVADGQEVVFYDGSPVIVASDTTLTSGMIALDASKQPVSFRNAVVAGNKALDARLSSGQSSFSFTVSAGATSATQPLLINTSDGSVAAWSALSIPPWVVISPTTGSTPLSATVQVNAASLAQGTYSGDIHLVSFGANGALSLPVSVTVLPLAAPTPVFDPPGGTYSSAQTVTITDSQSGASVYYTTDGSTPTISSTPYTGPISVATTETIHAIAVASGYSPSTVGSSTYTINVPDFALSGNTKTLTVARGKSASVSLTINPVNGYGEVVSFACSGLPAEASCTFKPSSITPNGKPVATQLTIATTSPTKAALRRPDGFLTDASEALAFACLLGLLPGVRRRLRAGWFFAVVVGVGVCAGSLLGCGTGSSSGSAAHDAGTPTGTVQITVTATGGAAPSALQHSAVLTLTVTD